MQRKQYASLRSDFLSELLLRILQKGIIWTHHFEMIDLVNHDIFLSSPDRRVTQKYSDVSNAVTAPGKLSCKRSTK